MGIYQSLWVIKDYQLSADCLVWSKSYKNYAHSTFRAIGF